MLPIVPFRPVHGQVSPSSFWQFCTIFRHLDKFSYIKLRRSRDCLWVSCVAAAGVGVCGADSVEVCVIALLH